MDSCQFVAFATQLKNLLVIHDKAAAQVQLIETQIDRLNQQIFTSTTEGQHGLTLHLSTKKSVAEGVKKIYQQFRQKKLQHIQKLSAHIIQSLQTDGATSTEPETSSDVPSVRDNDSLAQLATDSFCACSRNM